MVLAHHATLANGGAATEWPECATKMNTETSLLRCAPWVATTLAILSLVAQGQAAANCTAPAFYDDVSNSTTPGIQTFGSLAEINEAVGPCQTFFGNIEFDLDIMGSDVSLDQLVNITGSLKIDPYRGDFNGTINKTTSSTSLSLGSLQSVGGDLTIWSQTISHVNFSSLVSINGSLEVGNEYKTIAPLDILQFPKLSSLGGNLEMSGLHNLTTIEFPSLSSAGGLYLNYLPSLSSLSIPRGLLVAANYYDTRYTGLQLSSSVSVNGTALESFARLYISNSSSVSITNNPNLNNITIEGAPPAPFETRAGTVTIGMDKNGNDTSVAFPHLTSYPWTIGLNNISTLDISDLQNANGTLSIPTSLRSFNATNLKTAGIIQFDGLLGSISNSRLSKASFPVLEHLDNLYISDGANWSLGALYMPKIISMTSFSCLAGCLQDFCQEWSHKRCLGVITSDFYCGKYYKVPVLNNTQSCNRQYPASGWIYAKKLKLGLGIGLGVPFGALLCFLIWRGCKNLSSQVSPSNAPVELTDLPDGDQLPKYQQHESVEEFGTLPLPGYTNAAPNERDVAEQGATTQEVATSAQTESGTDHTRTNGNANPSNHAV